MQSSLNLDAGSVCGGFSWIQFTIGFSDFEDRICNVPLSRTWYFSTGKTGCVFMTAHLPSFWNRDFMFHSSHVIFGIPTSVYYLAAHFLLPGTYYTLRCWKDPAVSLEKHRCPSEGFPWVPLLFPNMWEAVAFPLAVGSSCLKGNLCHFSLPPLDFVCHTCGLRQRADDSLQSYFSVGIHRILNTQASTHMTIQSLTTLAFFSQPFPMADYSSPHASRGESSPTSLLS